MLRASHGAAGYMDRKIFQPFSQLPFSLTQGDVSANLEALAIADDPITEPTAVKIRALLDMGYNRARLADGVRLI